MYEKKKILYALDDDYTVHSSSLAGLASCCCCFFFCCGLASRPALSLSRVASSSNPLNKSTSLLTAVEEEEEEEVVVVVVLAGVMLASMASTDPKLSCLLGTPGLEAPPAPAAPAAAISARRLAAKRSGVISKERDEGAMSVEPSEEGQKHGRSRMVSRRGWLGGPSLHTEGLQEVLCELVKLV